MAIKLDGIEAADGRLPVDSVALTALAQASKERRAYSWTNVTADIDAGDTLLFVKNLSPKTLVIDKIFIGASNVACVHDVGIGNATTTPAGTAVTGVPLFGSTEAPDATAFGDETAVADATRSFAIQTAATTTTMFPVDGAIRLPQGWYIQINQETESTAGHCAVFGYYEA